MGKKKVEHVVFDGMEMMVQIFSLGLRREFDL